MSESTSSHWRTTNSHPELLTPVIRGGKLLRSAPFPCRDVMGKDALKCVEGVFRHYWQAHQDVPYQAHFEAQYCEQFARYYGGGFADAVNSGSVAVYLTLMALGLEKDSKVMISPVTDPGSVSAVFMAGYQPVVADAEAGLFNIGPDTVNNCLVEHPDIKAALLTHVGGLPIDMPAISTLLAQNDIELIEDCSQIHGGKIGDKFIGTFGRFAAFSTMFTKNHTTGSTGGVVLCFDEADYWLIRGLADRQKPFNAEHFNPRDPGGFLGPGLNYNCNEIACALGMKSLAVLDSVIARRQEQANTFNAALRHSAAYVPIDVIDGGVASYFFLNVNLSNTLTDAQVDRLKAALTAEQSSINQDYRYVVCEWDWFRKYAVFQSKTPNAILQRQRSINILYHEKYSDADIKDVLLAMHRAECFALEQTD